MEAAEIKIQPVRLKRTRVRGLITKEGLSKGLPIFTQAQVDIREAFRGF